MQFVFSTILLVGRQTSLNSLVIDPVTSNPPVLERGIVNMMKRTGAEDLGDFYPIRPDCQADTPKPRFKPRAGKTLSERRWNAAFSEDGHLDIEKVLRRIQRGGVHPAIKGSVWEFVLGCFDPNSTYEVRNQLRQCRREQYIRWKAECQHMVPVIGSGKLITTPIITDDGQPLTDSSINSTFSDKRSIQWMRALHQIGLDVVRTDRALAFYDSEKNQAKLWDILAVYAWVDNDISYVQGMNDICSPMVILLENEADAFWCFERAMRRLLPIITKKSYTYPNARERKLQVQRKFDGGANSAEHAFTKELDGGEYLFAFRMLMVLFRREFSFADSLYLWEVRRIVVFVCNSYKNEIYIVNWKSLVARFLTEIDWFQLMWAMEYNPNIFSLYEKPIAESDKSAASVLNNKLLKQCGKFERNKVKTGCTDKQSALAVFLVASVLEAKNKRILKEAKGLDDVVQILSDITGNMDARKVCKDALKIHKKYLSKARHFYVNSPLTYHIDAHSIPKAGAILTSLSLPTLDNDDEEPEMQIGFPTDVKHVAHIGWDGPSMNGFHSQPPYSSAPLSLNRDVKEEGSTKWESEGSNRKGSRAPNSPAGVPSSPGGSQSSPSRDFPELPKSSRRRSSTGTLAESPSREKSDKPKQSRRSSRNGTKELDGTRTSRDHKDPSGESESHSNLPDIPKKSRRKKSKDVSVEGSTSRSRSKAPAPEGGGEAEMITKSSNNDGRRQTGGSSTSRDGEESGLSGIS
ncbi:hypothetical protein SADUNF_Sadunf05G0170800 [Salix dunnii]|uniref:Ypt/Rab-GAP domain of gyp1p superfamily protein n=1 Tax=Salix dunnii TaxID=1413687 RepID=A0A835K4N0_9ROSI|nr:hypothetical protein SADUNF_Sadunf05G0170800 [Salix dunnii]